MEYLPGLSLADLVERHGPLPPERVIYLLDADLRRTAQSACPGPGASRHQAGRTSSRRSAAACTTWPSCSISVWPRPPKGPTSAQLTQDGTITGSPLYMSPEQALGTASPTRGATSIRWARWHTSCSSGVRRSTIKTRCAVMVAHAHDEVVPPSRIRPDIPSDLEQVVLRALVKNPAERFQSAAALGRALEECESASHWSREQATNWWEQIEKPAAVAAL